HQHATKVKEVQLSPKIDPHDLGVKIQHAVDFLCEDMKVKVNLKFRGREMAHTEFGFQVIRKFMEEIAPYGHQDFEPKLNGRNINVMVSPLPRNKRAKNPHAAGETSAEAPGRAENNHHPAAVESEQAAPAASSEPKQGKFVNNPFAEIEAKR